MTEYIVTHRKSVGIGGQVNGMTYPQYRIAADSARQAKETACRLDGQPSQFSNFYIAIRQKKEKRRPAATDRRPVERETRTNVMKTKDIISQPEMKCKWGRWL